ncbi:MAG: histidine--tRNA ligase [Chitinispirillia bacterium]|jgi:histidyl-tRNA synthetase
MAMKSTLSGYPEWLPEDKMVEQKIISIIKNKFELYGFTQIETRSVEPLSVILSKGETDKEIYTLRRLQATEKEGNKEIGLHFDLTVPFARYVVENMNELVFPFRRYQIQKAWRGERPGLGRYREFLQADIDIVDTRPLSVQIDIEILELIIDTLASIAIPRIQIHINNRKLLEGFYNGLNLRNTADILRIVDKYDKIGEEKVKTILKEDLNLNTYIAEKCIEIGKIKTDDTEVLKASVSDFGFENDLLKEGLYEIVYVLEHLPGNENISVVADLSIARGFDYYTGTVCEVKFLDFPKYPAIAAGGRYDNLVSVGKSKLPGIGMSIGITRILGLLLHEKLLKSSRSVSSVVLVALVSQKEKANANRIARSLRDRGIPCEVFPHPLKYGKQISYADKKRIPYVWFPPENGIGDGDIRDLRNREQQKADSKKWMPSDEDMRIQIEYDNEVMKSLLKNKNYL